MGHTKPKNKDHKYSLVDTEAFEKFFGGIERKMGVNIYVKTANIFLKNIEVRIQTLADALRDFDNQTALVTSHQIKGSLLSLGGNSLADQFREIEMSINLTPNNELLTILNNLLDNLKIFNEELKLWITELESSIAH